MTRTRGFAILLCLLPLPLPSVAQPVPLLRPAPGRVVNVSSARVRDYLSPDGKYVAHIAPQHGEGGEEVPPLVVLRHGVSSRTHSVSTQWETLSNFIWLPHKPHTLVAALNSAGDFTSALLLWHGPKQTVTLRQGKDTADDDFSIVRVSADGRTLFYKRYGYDAPVPSDYKTAKVRRINLPR